MKKLIKLKNNVKGQSLVEFALVLPLLLLLVFGIIQFGMIFSAKTTLTNISREAVRYTALKSEIDIDKFIKDSIEENPLLKKYANDAVISIIPDKSSIIDGEPVTVKIVINEYDLILPYPVESISLDGSATMMVETNSIIGGGIPGESGNYEQKLDEFRTIYINASDSYALHGPTREFWNDGGGSIGVGFYLLENLIKENANTMNTLAQDFDGKYYHETRSFKIHFSQLLNAYTELARQIYMDF